MLDVHGTTAPGFNGQGTLSPNNTHLDPCMDLKNLPDYLKPLIKVLAEDLTVGERGELAAAIYEYRDVFSSGLDDMG